jgi:hypothetical protein
MLRSSARCDISGQSWLSHGGLSLRVNPSNQTNLYGFSVRQITSALSRLWLRVYERDLARE